MDGNGNGNEKGNDYTGVKQNGNNKSNSRTPLVNNDS